MGPSAYDDVVAKQKREASASNGDYVQSAVRQDTWIDGAVASYIGSQFKPDPSFNPYDEKTFKEISQGVPEEFHNELLKSQSMAQAIYTRQRLEDKMTDMRRLGDMGFVGNSARFLAGFVEPTNLALGLASGGATALTRGLGMAGRIATGVGTAGAAGYALERTRQQFNYEDSQKEAVWAGLMGMAFSAPFVGLHAREQAAIRQIATKHLEVLNAVDGGNATPAAEAAARDIQARTEALRPEYEGDAVARENDPVKASEVDKAYDARDTEAAARRAADEERIWQAGANGEELDAVDYGLYTKDRAAARAEKLAKMQERIKAAQKANTIAAPEAAPAAAPAPAAGGTAMEQAFARAEATRNSEMRDLLMKAGGEKPAVQETPVSTAPVQAPAPVQESHVGKGTWGVDESGEPLSGEIMAEKDGKLLIKDDTTGRVRTVDPALLAPEAPGHKPTPLPEGMAPASMGAASSGQAVPVELTAMSKARFDTYARLNRSENPVVQQATEAVMKDAIGKVDAEGTPLVQRRTASEDKKMMMRTVGGKFHYVARQAYDEAAKALGWGWWERTKPSNVDGFYQLVGKAMRDERVYAENPDIAPMLRKAVSAAREVYGTMLDHMQKAGVHGSETIAANPDYMNRVWMQSRIREMENLHGADEVKKLFANAIRDKAGVLQRFRERNAASPLTDHEILQQSAGKFIDSVKALEHSHLSTELLLTATDAPTLRAELKKAKLSDAEAESVISHLFEHAEATNGDAGNPSPLKYRFNLDEATRHTTAKGETLALSDLMENDSRIVVDRYMNSMAGHVAMARKGIKSRAEWNGVMRAADENHVAAGSSRDAKRFSDEKQMLQDVYDNVVGRPMSVHSFNTIDRVANAARAYGRSVYLGQLGFTAAHEAFHSAGLMTWRAALQQMPSLRQFWIAAKQGAVPTNSLANDVRLMLGTLNEHVSGYLRQHEVTDFTYDKRLNRVENAANMLSHATDKFSGNSFMTTLTRGMAAAGTIQKYANFARGVTKLTDAQRARLVGAGMHVGDIDRILARLKDHVELDGNRVTGVKWEDWSAKDPNTYHDFLTAVDREVRQGVQDHDIGETWYQQHTALGKFLTELRAFNIAGHSKQMLNSMHYRDRTSLQLWTTSILVNAMAYVNQTAMNFAHNQAELDKRLTAERIVRAAYQRSNMMGLMPFLTDTLVPGFISPYAQGSGQGLTANTDSRNLLMPPSMALVARGINFMQNGRPQDGLSLLPGSNTYGARNLIDMIGQAHKQHLNH